MKIVFFFQRATFSKYHITWAEFVKIVRSNPFLMGEKVEIFFFKHWESDVTILLID